MFHHVSFTFLATVTISFFSFFFIYIPGSSLERTSKSLHQHWQLLGAITFFFLKITFKYQLIVFFRIFSNKALDNRLALLKCYLFRFVVMVTQPNIITKELLAYLFSNTSFCSECCHLKITLATLFFLFSFFFKKVKNIFKDISLLHCTLLKVNHFSKKKSLQSRLVICFTA